MCAVLRDLHFLEQAGMDFDSAIEYRGKNDHGAAYNFRFTGTQNLESGYGTNIESNLLLSASVAPGISRGIGSAGFESMRIGLEFYYNSAGFNQIREINYDTQVVTPINISVWPLSPQHYVNDIKIINNEFLCFNDNFNPPAYINYNRLKSGGYTNLSYNDFLLIKRQPQIAATAVFNNDKSRSVNLLSHILFQFRSQYIGLDFEQSVYSTISELFIPEEESTPEVGTDVTVNNNLLVTVDAGDNSTSQLIVLGCYGGLQWFKVITINRSEILALPAAIDLSSQIYQAYDPATNLFTFVFYNDGLYENVAETQTDQLYDNVPLQAGAMEVLNGNELILGDITTGYDRPVVPVLLNVTNYNPNLTVPPIFNNPMTVSVVEVLPASGNRQQLLIEYGGSVQEGDTATIILVDRRNSGSTLVYTLGPATFAEIGLTAQFISDNAGLIPGASVYFPPPPNDVGLNIFTPPFFILQSAYVTLFNAGSGVFKSIHALKLNSAYQAALAIYDEFGRPVPLVTDSSLIKKTNSYAQAHGQTPQINWAIQSAVAPITKGTFQWVISPNNTHQSDLYTLASIVAVQGNWNATTNSPTLSSGTIGGSQIVGHSYLVTVPGSQNLGNGPTSFDSGDFIVYNGLSWDIVPKSYGDISNTEAYYFYLNSLNAFNTRNNTSVLSYDFTVNDRCTLAYYQAPGPANPINWFDGVANAIVDVEVLGYDASTFFLKVNKSPSIDPSVLSGNNVLLELYTPKKRTQTDATGATVASETVFFETGQVYTITNGQFDTLSGTITQGDAYFQVQELTGSVDTNQLYEILVENFNFSPFYPSQFWSKGRPRSYSDVLGRTRQVANMPYSLTYIIGSQNNGLTRFFPENVYGNGGGQTSSNYGAIVKLIQVNNELVVLQELDHGTVPVYINIIEDQAEQQNVAISDQILGNIRYTNGKHIGVGQGVRSIAVYNNVIYWVDSNRNEPIRWSGNGAIPISVKMSKFFKSSLQAAYAAGLQPIGWYDIFNDEYVVSVPQQNGIVTDFPFSAANWQFSQQFSVLPAEISITSGPSHSSASYNNINGIAVLTPNTDYVGNDSMQISFPESATPVNVCFNWIAGSGTVNSFFFFPVTGATQSAVVASNTISVGGNDYPVAISITGSPGFGYSVNGGAFTASPGTVNKGDIVQVQVTASASISTTTSCTLTIDGQSATFDVTTNAGGNFSADAQYGLTIKSITGSGVPAGFASVNITPGNSLSLPYTSASGMVQINVIGSPVLPAQLVLYVAGVDVSHVNVPFAANYNLTFPVPANDPTTVRISVNLQ